MSLHVPVRLRAEAHVPPRATIGLAAVVENVAATDDAAVIAIDLFLDLLNIAETDDDAGTVTDPDRLADPAPDAEDAADIAADRDTEMDADTEDDAADTAVLPFAIVADANIFDAAEIEAMRPTETDAEMADVVMIDDDADLVAVPVAKTTEAADICPAPVLVMVQLAATEDDAAMVAVASVVDDAPTRAPTTLPLFTAFAAWSYE